MNPRVKEVFPQNDYTLKIVFTNNEVRLFDVKPYLGIGVFKELNDKELFDTAAPTFGTVAWKNGQDFCPDTLYLESIVA